MTRLVFASFVWLHRFQKMLDHRFTGGGLLALGALTVSAVVGLDTYQTMAYQVFTFLLAVLLIAFGGSLLFRPSLTVERILPRFVTAGEPLSYAMEVRNHGIRKQTGLRVAEEIDNPVPDFLEFISSREPWEGERNWFDRHVGYHRWRWLQKRKQRAVSPEQDLPDLPLHGSRRFTATITPLRRGRLDFRGITIVRPDPLGLIKARKTIPLADSVMVLPRRYRLPPIALPGTRRYQSGGVALAASVGDSEEFVALRDYRAGDPLRHIHWKSWAKTDKPVIKEFQDEFFVRHALVLDTFRSGEDEVFEAAVSIAASFAFSIVTQESLLDLMFIGDQAYCFTAGRGVAHTDRMLEILAAVEPCTDKSFGTLWPLVASRSEILSGCICILLGWDDERQALVRRLKGVGTPVLALVISPVEVPQQPGDLESPEVHFLQAGRITEGLARL